MEPFATIDDFKDFYPDAQVNSAQVTALIKAGSVILARRLESSGISVFGDELLAEDLKFTVCSMVNRALMTADDGPYTQMTDTVGPYTQSRTLSNPDQRLYLTKAEEKRLGLVRGSLGTIRVAIGGADDSW